MRIFGRWELRRIPPPPPPRARPPLAVPGTPVTDLEQHVYAASMGIHPGLRNFDARWVMSPWWLNWCRKLATDHGSAMQVADVQLQMIGIPVEVRASGGWPHLEPTERSRITGLESPPQA